MNVKETLKKLHEQMPNLSTDELITILDCYVEHEFYASKTTTNPWIYDNENRKFTETPGIVYTSSGKCTGSI